ncbi:MAG TPA: carbohydrate ABC transporter substrate-binding protein [Acholeplasmataceae bacterium]|jgi:oligogalacturonide transport system substrate-binding protein|nr:carbohydrate ABC transporter substrate-binding protein [Acholeplasmataceae bacterium]
MKKFFLILTLLFTAFSLTSCKKDDYVIKFSWWGTSDRNIATYRVIELFNEKYPEYKILGDGTAWSGYQASLNNQLHRGTEADIFQVNYNWIYQMYGIDYFMDIKELGIDFSKYPEEEHKPLTVEGKVLALSASETGYILYLNKKVYDDAGITEIPKTWSDLIEAGKTISSKTPGKYAIGRLDAQQVAILIFAYLGQKTGKNVISNDNKLNFTLAELEEGFNFIDTLRSNGVLIPSNSEDTYNEGFSNPNWTTHQNYGGVLTWNTAISEYENTLPSGSELITAGFPQINLGEKLGMYKKVSMGFAVSKRVEKSDLKKAAVKTFLEFITTDPEAVLILGVDRGISSHADTQAMLKDSKDHDFTKTNEWLGHEIVQDYYNNQLSLGQKLYIHPYYEHDTFRKIYEDQIEKFLRGTATGREAAQRIINNFNKELERVME